MTVTTSAPTSPDHRLTASVALLAAGLLLGSGLPLQLLPSAPLRIGTAVLGTAVLAAAAAVAGRGGRLAPARDGLRLLAVLSVFGWVSALVLALPTVAAWSKHAPVAVVFLVVNALKLSSVVPLLVLARRWGWSWRAMWVRRGEPRARHWPVLAVLVMLAVEALFLTLTPGVDAGHVSLLLPWLPVMLAGACVNAACEELLYRHALIGTSRALLGTVGATVTASVVFGLAHLTGTPGGLSGVLFTAGYGAVCAVAMLQTRGCVWNLAIHVAGDLSAVTTLVLAAS